MYQPLSDLMDDEASAAVVVPPRSGDEARVGLFAALLELMRRTLVSEVPA